MKLIIILLYILAKPISLVLDWILGDDPGTVFTDEQMKTLFTMYEEDALLNPN